MQNAPVVYGLTRLTGSQRNENRRTVIATVEVKRRTFIVSTLALALALPVTGMLFVFIGMYALIAPFLFVGVALWLWDSRQRSGLQLLNYQAIVDQRRSLNGVLYAAGFPLPDPVLVTHQRQTIPAPDEIDDAPVAYGTSNMASQRAKKKRSRKRPRVEARYIP